MAIQVSRLNEAMLIAFSAMSPTNLKAVDQVVKIVRELDRYGGAFAAEWARPEASGLDAPSDEDAAFASAWLHGAEPGLPSPVAALHSPSRDGRPHVRPPERGDAVDDRVYKTGGAGVRPEIALQGLDNIDFAPGRDAPSPACGRRWPAGPDEGLRALTPAHCHERERERAASAGDVRPENPAQGLEKVKSAPGIGTSSETAEAAPADPVSTSGLFLSLLRSPAGRQDLRAGLSGLRAGTYGLAHQEDGGDFPLAAPAGRARPENLAQRLENMESAPGTSWLDEAGSRLPSEPADPLSDRSRRRSQDRQRRWRVLEAGRMDEPRSAPDGPGGQTGRRSRPGRRADLCPPPAERALRSLDIPAEPDQSPPANARTIKPEGP